MNLILYGAVQLFQYVWISIAVSWRLIQSLPCQANCRASGCNVFPVLPVANWFFMIASTFLITAIGTLVTDKLVEPRLTPYVPDASEQVQDIAENEKRGMRFAGITALVYVLLRNYSVISIKKFLRKNIRTCNIYILTVLSLKPTQTSIPGYGRKRLKNPDTACLRRSLPCFRKLILSFNTRG